MEKEKIGITLITGFLGAGKTSLLNHIILKEKRYKFAIIENEFSELGIDAELIAGIDSGRIVELSNGCICCTRNTELQETLLQLVESGLLFNHVLIETTGIAEPDSIVQSIVSNPELKSAFYIDSVICLADAHNYYLNLESSEAYKQLAMADIVIINKIETSDNQLLDKIEKEIFQINPLCEIIKTSYGDYQDFQLIGNKSFNYMHFEKLFDEYKSKFAVKLEPVNKVQSAGILIDGDFIEEKFRFWIEYFLMLNQNTIYRAKGIISFKGNSRKIIFQAVKASFTIEEGNFWATGNRMNRIIFIGKELDKIEIHNSLSLLMSN